MEGIRTLMGGMSTAFLTSIVGITCSVWWLFEFRFAERKLKSGLERFIVVTESFNKGPGFDAMILSPEAAGVGLNITGPTHVVHYTRLWNPAKENQATDRVHRIGQNHPVTIHYPIVVGNGFKSVEQHLHDLLREKLQLARNVLVPRKSLDFMGELERRVTRGDGP